MPEEARALARETQDLKTQDARLEGEEESPAGEAGQRLSAGMELARTTSASLHFAHPAEEPGGTLEDVAAAEAFLSSINLDDDDA